MAHNGGKHGWDITAAQAREAAYVSPKNLPKASKKEGPWSLIELEVVQRHVNPLRDYHMHCKTCSALALPPDFLSPALESFRYQYRLSDCSAYPFLHKYDPREDMGVYPPGQGV